jgi:cation diffusion facilitator CzcD-associated flavoprotein CzcO
MSASTMNVCIIGGGYSGVCAASVLRRRGLSTVIYEGATKIGGVWLTAYDKAACQNTSWQYHLPDFSWQDAGVKPSFNPTKTELLAYLEAAVDKKGLDVRLGHKIQACERAGDKWVVRGRLDTGIAFIIVFDICTRISDSFLFSLSPAGAYVAKCVCARLHGRLPFRVLRQSFKRLYLRQKRP